MINPVSRIIGLVLQPEKTFNDAKDDSLVFVFSLYLLIVFLSSVLNLVFATAFLSAQPSLKVFFLLDAAFSFLFTIIGALVGTGMLAIVTRIARKRQTLRPAARVFLYASIPIALFYLVVAGMSGLQILWGPSIARWIFSAQWILFIAGFIWTIVLGIIGLKVSFGISTFSAAVCAGAGFFADALLSVMYSYGSFLLIPVQVLVVRLLTMPAILVAVFGLYYLLESRQLVQEQRNTWEITQLYSWGAIAVLIAGFLYFPLYRHGGVTDMSQLSMSLQILTESSTMTASTMGMQQTGMIAVIGLMIVLFFLHGTGIVNRKIPLLSSVLSFVFLAISAAYIAGWQAFYHAFDSRPVEPYMGTWIVPLVGIIYLLIVLFYKETAPTGDETKKE